MDGVPQHPGESPAAWLERLLRMGIERDLTNEERRQLARFVLAAQRAAGVAMATADATDPDSLARSLLAIAPTEPFGPLFVQLSGATGDVVSFGPYDNPSLALHGTINLRRLLAEVVREARREGSKNGG
jgi:hypothetical protein